MMIDKNLWNKQGIYVLHIDNHIQRNISFRNYRFWDL